MSLAVEAIFTDQFLEPEETTAFLRPRFEGSNICSWIGFKHVMYLVEEAILEHFRNAGFFPRELFENHGLCLEIVDSDARILHALHMDDLVEVTIKPRRHDNELRYNVSIFVDRDGTRLKAVVAKVTVVFKLDDSPVTNVEPATVLPKLAPYTVERIIRPEIVTEKRAVKPDLSVGRGVLNPDEDIMARLTSSQGTNVFVWKWHIPYFYCHFTERMQHSGYLRLLEEVEDLFLADRGISIRTMLHTKKLIPVVPHARVQILEEAYMEETLYTAYTLEEQYKEFTYTHRMDCYVVRDRRPIKTATGIITHGYATINNRRDWSLIGMDSETLAAISSVAAAPKS